MYCGRACEAVETTKAPAANVARVAVLAIFVYIELVFIDYLLGLLSPYTSRQAAQRAVNQK
jgi:hypothetical protein